MMDWLIHVSLFHAGKSSSRQSHEDIQDVSVPSLQSGRRCLYELLTLCKSMFFIFAQDFMSSTKAFLTRIP